MKSSGRYKSKASRKRANDKLKIGRNLTIENGLKAKNKYENNPKLCLECNKPIDYEKRVNTYCSQSCGASYSNKNIKIYIQRRKDSFCINCGKKINGRSDRKYCNTKCQAEKNQKDSFLKNLPRYNAGEMNDEEARRFFRKINIDKKCSICELENWNDVEIPVVVDHIDGNHNNNFPNNLRYVCNNCDALLPTFKAKNKGNGRTNRKK